MPYISSENVKKIRDALKKALPDFKLSVTRRHHSSVDVALMAGPVDFGCNNDGVNRFYYKRDYADNPAAIKVFDTIMQVMNERCKQKELVYDSDYGSVPNYYQNIQIGKWNKPYVITK
ncbi:MAG: hypothetical protein OEY94_08720 [Alphaproteobacteria bacterium]|nr:hypothetical protein [Alphaproteobacteria bacterium]